MLRRMAVLTAQTLVVRVLDDSGQPFHRGAVADPWPFAAARCVVLRCALPVTTQWFVAQAVADLAYLCPAVRSVRWDHPGAPAALAACLRVWPRLKWLQQDGKALLATGHAAFVCDGSNFDGGALADDVETVVYDLQLEWPLHVVRPVPARVEKVAFHGHYVQPRELRSMVTHPAQVTEAAVFIRDPTDMDELAAFHRLASLWVWVELKATHRPMHLTKLPGLRRLVASGTQGSAIAAVVAACPDLLEAEIPVRVCAGLARSGGAPHLRLVVVSQRIPRSLRLREAPFRCLYHGPDGGLLDAVSAGATVERAAVASPAHAHCWIHALLDRPRVRATIETLDLQYSPEVQWDAAFDLAAILPAVRILRVNPGTAPFFIARLCHCLVGRDGTPHLTVYAGQMTALVRPLVTSIPFVQFGARCRS